MYSHYQTAIKPVRQHEELDTRLLPTLELDAMKFALSKIARLARPTACLERNWAQDHAGLFSESMGEELTKFGE